MKLKDDKTCHCPGGTGSDADRIVTYCRFGYCTILRCPWCEMIDCEWGPIACPHKKNENGTLRWYKYPDMDKKTHVAIKENKMRKPKRTARNM